MERRPARVSPLRDSPPQGGIQDVALTGAPSPSAWPKGETCPRESGDQTTGSPGPQTTGAMTHVCLTSEARKTFNLMVRSAAQLRVSNHVAKMRRNPRPHPSRRRFAAPQDEG